MSTYGQRLEKALKNSKKSRKDLATALEISVQAIGDAIRGKTAAFTAANNSKAASFLGVDGDWLATGDSEQIVSTREPVAISLENNPDYPAIKHVHFKLSAGCSGYGVEYTNETKRPLVFGRQWYEEHGYKPNKLFAVKIANGSMEPGLVHDDMVVVNTADTELKDGKVFAMNFEGELVIKRLVRDGGAWWLSSDNPDQRRYPRKICDEHVFCLGRIVHKQSETI
jgi:phage repressor protein C with HTH and peptisase S24 domain